MALAFPEQTFGAAGTTLPIEVMPKAMQKIVSVFPLTLSLTMMKNTFLGISAGSVLLPICVMLGTAVLCAIFAVRFLLGMKHPIQELSGIQTKR